MPRPPVLLITGATGATGRAVLEALGPVDATVRVATRSTTKPVPEGTERALLDMDDAESVRQALVGVTAAYLVTPSSARAEQQQLAFLEAADAAGVEHLVLLSQLGAAPDSPVRFLRYHAVAEQALVATRMAGTVLRPNLFMQGLVAMRDVVRTEGILPAPIGSARVSAIDVRDIGAVAARALTSAEPLGTLTLTGPEALTHGEMATALSQATGQEIRYVDTPPDEFASYLRGVLPDWQIAGLLEDYAHYARGEAGMVTDAVELATGSPARDFAQFARDSASAFS